MHPCDLAERVETLRVHVVLRGRELQRSLVDGRGFGIDDLAHARLAGRFEDVDRAGHVDVGRLDRVVLTIRDTILGGQVKDDVRSGEGRLQVACADVALDEIDACGDLFAHAVGQIVDARDAEPLAEKSVGEIAADESRDAGHGDTSFHRCRSEALFGSSDRSLTGSRGLTLPRPIRLSL